MFTIILLVYLLGVVLGYILLLIGNTIAVKYNDTKAPIKQIIFSWLVVILFIMFIIEMLYKYSINFSKIKEFFNKKPDLIKDK